MTTKITQTEKKYLDNVGKLFYNHSRRRLCMVEKLFKADYGNAFKYDILYFGVKNGTKRIHAKQFTDLIGVRFIEVKSEEEYNKLLDGTINSVLK